MRPSIYSCFPSLHILVTSLTLTAQASNVPQISAGSDHSLILKADGSVWVWGANDHGQLGLGNTAQQMTPHPLVGLDDVESVAAGDHYSFAIKHDGTVWGWGVNTWGELGLGDRVDHYSPQAIPALNHVVAISGYGHSLAVQSDGSVWAWGRNGNGELGLGDIEHRFSPQKNAVLNDIVAVSAGLYHSIALKRDGSVWAWGGNVGGQLGLGDTTDRHLPEQIPGLGDVVAVSASYEMTLALKRDGTVWAWGANSWGDLGMGDETSRSSPQQIHSLNNIVAIATGVFSGFALKSDGTVWSWGRNGGGQLGLGEVFFVRRPRQITTVDNIVAFSGSRNGLHNFALKQDGSLWTWGWNKYGQLGLGNRTSVKLPQMLDASNHIVSALTRLLIIVDSIQRGTSKLTHESFTISTLASAMTMDFDSADVARTNSLASYQQGTCVSGAISTGTPACTFDVRSTASGRIGLQQAQLSIPASDTFTKAVIVPVVATVGGADLFADTRSPYRYSTTNLSSFTDKTFRYSNKGDADISINNITQFGDKAFQVVSDNCTGQTLSAEASCSIVVRFSATVSGMVSGSFSVNSNDPVTPKKWMRLEGIGML